MLGDKIAGLRKQRNLSQYELAERLGFSRGKLANYEQGSRQPDYDSLKKIADFFNVSTDYLLGRSEDPHKSEQDYLKSIIENDKNFDGFVIEKDGKPLDLEEMLAFLENKDITLKGELLTGEERRRAIEVLKVMFNIKKDT